MVELRALHERRSAIECTIRDFGGDVGLAVFERVRGDEDGEVLIYEP